MLVEWPCDVTAPHSYSRIFMTPLLGRPVSGMILGVTCRLFQEECMYIPVAPAACEPVAAVSLLGDLRGRKSTCLTACDSVRLVLGLPAHQSTFVLLWQAYILLTLSQGFPTFSLPRTHRKCLINVRTSYTKVVSTYLKIIKANFFLFSNHQLNHISSYSTVGEQTELKYKRKCKYQFMN